MKESRDINDIINRFRNLVPFRTPDDIPSIPRVCNQVYNEIIVPNLIRCGAIPKKDLIVGQTYIGDCRNSNEATWNGKVFEYIRYKFGTTFTDEINHFEDDDGYDLFVPIRIKSE